MNLTNSIRKMREEKNITQQELADAVSVSRQTIVAIEKGNYEPSLGLAIKLAQYFKTTVEDVFIIK